MHKMQSTNRLLVINDFVSSLVKMVYGFAQKSGSVPTWKEMEHAVLRNFGGLDSVQPVDVFVQKLAASINVNAPVSLFTSKIFEEKNIVSMVLHLLC